MERPLILISCWRRRLPTYLGERTLLDTLDPAYSDRVAQAGGQPLLLSRPARDHADVARRLVGLADGLLLSGGGDVDPASYGEAADNVEGQEPAADAFELALIEAARAARLPTLGICRGAQLLAVAHGGRLAQRPATTADHPELAGQAPDAILAARHPVALASGSRVRDALGADEITVNTIHHHQIADAGELVVTGTAPGGVIEALESPGDWACVGVQWHPEKMCEPEQRGLFAWFVADASVRERIGVAAP